jgi:hypothetical protein
LTAINKTTLSTAFVGFFILTLALSTVLSEFFQAPIISSQELSKLQYLFTDADIKGINEFRLETSLVDFKVKKENSGWLLTTPRNINANEKLINDILSSLKTVRIKKIYPRDEINLANFSLNNPLAKLTLTTNTGREKTLSFGLVNPINNTTYVSLDTDDAIYHVNLLGVPIEKIELANIIDSRIFSMPWQEVESIKITNKNQLKLDIKKEKRIWYQGRRQLAEDRVTKFLQEVVNIKSTVILDERTDKLERRLKGLLEKPFFKMEIKTKSGEIVTYDVSYVLNSLPDIKMEKKQNFIIRASNRKHPFVVNKSYVKYFYYKNSSFKTLSIKKLIY